MRCCVTMIVSLVAGLVLAAASSFAADEDKVGTAPGNLLPGPFHPYNVTGERKGKHHCLVCQYGLKPVVLIFTREAPEAMKPLTKLVKDLDEAIGADPSASLRGFVVFVSDDKDRAALDKKLSSWADEAKLMNVVVCRDEPGALAGYDLDKEAEATVIVYDKLRVAKKHTFGKDKLTDNDVRTIVSEAKSLVEKKK
jgi:hypothetical protein